MVFSEIYENPRKTMKYNIPKGYRRVRLGELFPQSVYYVQTYDNNRGDSFNYKDISNWEKESHVCDEFIDREDKIIHGMYITIVKR